MNNKNFRQNKMEEKEELTYLWFARTEMRNSIKFSYTDQSRRRKETGSLGIWEVFYISSKAWLPSALNHWKLKKIDSHFLSVSYKMRKRKKNTLCIYDILISYFCVWWRNRQIWLVNCWKRQLSPPFDSGFSTKLWVLIGERLVPAWLGRYQMLFFLF